MENIYWIRDKKRCGPATVPDVISLVQMGELTRSTLGWHSGCDKWMPLEKLPALADFLGDLESSPSDVEAEMAPIPGESSPADNVAPRPDGLPPIPPRPTPGAAESPAPPGQQTPSARPGSYPSNGSIPERSTAYEGEGEPGGLPPMARRVFLPSPGVRFFARCIDYALYLSFFYLVVYAMGIEFELLLMPGSYLVWLPCAIIEGFYLSRLGTTPGKALMGIRLSVFGDVERIGVLRGTIRALLVFILGCGMMFFPLAVTMGILTLWVLRRRGITSWDARCSTLPIQVIPTSTERILAGLGIIFVSLVAVGFFLTPWTQPMLEALEEQQPGITQKIAPLLPRQYATITNKQEVIPQPSSSPAKRTASPAPQHAAPASATPAAPAPPGKPAEPAPPTAPQPTLLEAISSDPMLTSASLPPHIR